MSSLEAFPEHDCYTALNCEVMFMSFCMALLAPHHAIAMFSRAKVSLMAMERSLRT